LKRLLIVFAVLVAAFSFGTPASAHGGTDWECGKAVYPVDEWTYVHTWCVKIQHDDSMQRAHAQIRRNSDGALFNIEGPWVDCNFNASKTQFITDLFTLVFYNRQIANDTKQGGC
jgi:hypothetical protein